MHAQYFCVLLIFLYCNGAGDGYIVGSGLNARFGLMRTADPKFQVLRLKMLLDNTKAVVYHCLGEASACERSLSRIRYLASKNFMAVAKSVVLYVVSKSRARPTGYAGVPVYCHGTKCVIDVDPPPQIEGGCQQYIGCGGNKSWNLTSKPEKESSFSKFG